MNIKTIIQNALKFDALCRKYSNDTYIGMLPRYVTRDFTSTTKYEFDGINGFRFFFTDYINTDVFKRLRRYNFSYIVLVEQLEKKDLMKMDDLTQELADKFLKKGTVIKTTDALAKKILGYRNINSDTKINYLTIYL